MEEFVAILAENSPERYAKNGWKGDQRIVVDGRFYKKRFISGLQLFKRFEEQGFSCIKKNFTTRITFLRVSFLDYRSPCHFAQNIKGKKMETGKCCSLARVSISCSVYIASPLFLPAKPGNIRPTQIIGTRIPHPMNPPSCSVYYAPSSHFCGIDLATDPA